MRYLTNLLSFSLPPSFFLQQSQGKPCLFLSSQLYRKQKFKIFSKKNSHRGSSDIKMFRSSKHERKLSTDQTPPDFRKSEGSSSHHIQKSPKQPNAGKNETQLDGEAAHTVVTQNRRLDEGKELAPMPEQIEEDRWSRPMIPLTPPIMRSSSSRSPCLSPPPSPYSTSAPVTPTTSDSQSSTNSSGTSPLPTPSIASPARPSAPSPVSSSPNLTYSSKPKAPPKLDRSHRKSKGTATAATVAVRPFSSEPFSKPFEPSETS